LEEIIGFRPRDATTFADCYTACNVELEGCGVHSLALDHTNTMSSTPSRSWSVDAFVQAENNHFQTENQDESALSEVELRELYDEEEIKRFMRLFSAVRFVSQ
jgi:hypothetical protein